MGCYDTVRVECNCGGSVEFQSKAGYCAFYEYDELNTPAAVADDINYSSEKCGTCGSECTINFNIVIIPYVKWRKGE